MLELDRAEWGAACAFLAEAPRLGVQVLELVVVAGRPVRGRGGRGGGVGEEGFGGVDAGAWEVRGARLAWC